MYECLTICEIYCNCALRGLSTLLFEKFVRDATEITMRLEKANEFYYSNLVCCMNAPLSRDY